MSVELRGLSSPQATAGATASSGSRRAAAAWAAATAAPAEGVSYDGQTSRRAADIMAGRDLHNISRNEMLSMANELYDAGVITGEQRLDLTAPYADRWNPAMERTSNPDEKRDFLADLNAALEAVRRDTPDNQVAIAHLQKVKDLADSLAAVGGLA